MAEIKIQDGFTQELNAFGRSGESIEATPLTHSGALNLPMCDATCNVVNDLINAVKLYKQLINKDAKELDEFVKQMKRLDNA